MPWYSIIISEEVPGSVRRAEAMLDKAHALLKVLHNTEVKKG